ncbi:MAG: SH3 domain-containing protein [Candidatus Omnitrophica bacterium]|nr:SH3 domain-containing protein [Candidatus Omnitrophota bacterium]
MKLFSWGKVALLLPTLFFIAPPLACAAEPSDPTPVRFAGLITGDRVNLRAGPSLSYEILHHLPKGTRVQVVSKEGGWLAVLLPEEVSVYVSRGFLQVEGPKATVKTRRVHVRAGAGTAFTSLGFLNTGDAVVVRRFVNDWAEIQPPPSFAGWVSDQYVVSLEPEPGASDGNDRTVQAAGTESRKE